MKAVLVALILAVAATAPAQQTANINDLRLVRTSGTIALRHAADGVLRGYTEAGVESFSIDAATGEIVTSGSSVITDADARLHAQNTDIGTTSTVFTLGLGSTNSTPGFMARLEFGHQDLDSSIEWSSNTGRFYIGGSNGADILGPVGIHGGRTTVNGLTVNNDPGSATSLSVEAPVTGTTRRGLYVEAPTGGTTNLSAQFDGQVSVGDTLSVRKAIAGHTGIVSVTGTGAAGRGEIHVRGPAGAAFVFARTGGSPSQDWAFYTSSAGQNLAFYSYHGTAGEVLSIAGGTAKGVVLKASGTGGYNDLQYEGASRLKVDRTGIGFFGTTPVAQQTVTFGNTDSEISSLTFSSTPTQEEVEALRDKCEELADDVRALRAALETYGLID